ncbi:DMT family transporter [Roseibium sediminicola]|uniref:DMT family transporter n=1 Tax=Roseibium sediminicola TaxID=2933272 RepID=A0ABT0H329_9HYPH|nr:DMT family transporter [Roseibium sp. CAU 1639]MCK7616088.1 DMT family transporter [Roseibium sp. CAU 1639]
MTRQMEGMIGLIAAQTLLGTIGLCVLESGADPVSVAFYRCVIGGLALAFYCLWRGDLAGLMHVPRRTMLMALASGVLMAGNWVLFFEGIRQTGIAVATITFHIQPFLVVMLGAFVFRERLHAVTLMWIGLALVGLTLATGLTGAEFGADRAYLLGLGATLAAACLYAGVTVIAKGLTGLSAPQLATIQFLTGALLLLFFSPLGPTALSPEQWGWLGVIGLIHTGGVYVALYKALPKLTTPVIAVLLFLYPASAVVVDALAYDHFVTARQVAGLGLIILASLAVTLKWGFRKSAVIA